MRMTSDRKSTRLNSSHLVISYAVFCLKKKKKKISDKNAFQLGRQAQITGRPPTRRWYPRLRVARARRHVSLSGSSLFFFFNDPAPPEFPPFPPPDALPI